MGIRDISTVTRRLTMAEVAKRVVSSDTFESALKRVIAEGHRCGVEFDRAWDFRDEEDVPNVMVEITYVE